MGPFSSCQTITLPQPGDQLWIVTDGALTHGVGATLYVTRHGQPRLAGFFSTKLRERQVKWLPCEIEALSIALAIKHFSPYIIQSQHKAGILTDSKPCVQAFDKLCRGEFSASPRVSTFLSTASRYQASVRHLAGAANVLSDIVGRNTLPRENPSKCQVCVFVNQVEDSVVLRTHVSRVRWSCHLQIGNLAWNSKWLPRPKENTCTLDTGYQTFKKATNIKRHQTVIKCGHCVTWWPAGSAQGSPYSSSSRVHHHPTACAGWLADCPPLTTPSSLTFPAEDCCTMVFFCTRHGECHNQSPKRATSALLWNKCPHARCHSPPVALQMLWVCHSLLI